MLYNYGSKWENIKKVGRRPNQNDSDETLRKTLKEVRIKKLNFQDIKKKYGVSKSIINRKFNKNMLKVSRLSTLTK